MLRDEFGNEIDPATGDVICRFCGYVEDDHTCLVDGVRVCPDTEPDERGFD